MIELGAQVDKDMAIYYLMTQSFTRGITSKALQRRSSVVHPFANSFTLTVFFTSHHPRNLAQAHDEDAALCPKCYLFCKVPDAGVGEGGLTGHNTCTPFLVKLH